MRDVDPQQTQRQLRVATSGPPQIPQLDAVEPFEIGLDLIAPLPQDDKEA